MELINFTLNNRYATGVSYVSAQENKSSFILRDIESVARYVTDILVGFYSEKTGNYNRWEYISKSDLSWHVHSQTLDYETNLITIQSFIDSDGKWSCSGGIPDKYEISVKKVKDDFVVEVTTFVHMTIQSNMFSWFNEGDMKNALIEKMKYIKSH